MSLKHFYIVILFLLMAGFTRSFAQYQIVLKNDTLVSDSRYDFEIFIKSDGGTINLTSYQIILTINDSLTQGGNLTFSYINGSSQLTNIPNVHIGIINDGGVENLTAGSNPGNDTISTDYIRVGRFMILDSNPFGKHKIDLNWDFSGFVQQGININNFNQTNLSDHINLLSNPMPVITNITDKKYLPSKFQLFQNYPNPFNPTTNIKFEIPKETAVTLNIYNIIGQKIATLLNQKEMAAGFHSLTFDANSLPTGTYIYRLQAGDFVQTRKMILLK